MWEVVRDPHLLAAPAAWDGLEVVMIRISNCAKYEAASLICLFVLAGVGETMKRCVRARCC